jgi:pimeloyl-ACP methyl ester carboxylesterase
MRAGSAIVLVGWSLGGLFARELAKRQPHAVAKVITMGTPFSGSMRQTMPGARIRRLPATPWTSHPIDTDMAQKPPVETVAMWSARDGVISPAFRQRSSGRTRPGAPAALHPYGLHLLAGGDRDVLSELDFPPSIENRRRAVRGGRLRSPRTDPKGR